MMVDSANPEKMDLGVASHLFRTDALVGSGNLVGFSELLESYFNADPRPPFSLLAVDVNWFSRLNETHGHEQGDVALRWIGLALAEETRAPVYRIGGDEFVVVLIQGSPAEHAALGQRVFERLNERSEKFGLSAPAVTVAVIQYSDQEPVAPPDVFVHLSSAIMDVKNNFDRTCHTYQAADLNLSGDVASLRWTTSLMIKRIVTLGEMLDEWQKLAYTDPVSGLPNLRAAQNQLRTHLIQASAGGQPLAILLIDGDDLRRYNQISYAAGDEMIQRLGDTLRDQLRPGDFLARWRVGDEFLVLLPSTPLGQAAAVGRRLCQAVQQASESWPLPVTISIGVAEYPRHGTDETGLMHQAEAANDRAKALGKNCVVTELDT
jgi:diguanylate cyclase (GGDEF)-like protein